MPDRDGIFGHVKGAASHIQAHPIIQRLRNLLNALRGVRGPASVVPYVSEKLADAGIMLTIE